MLTDPPIEKLLPHVANRYVLSMLTAKRARQLVDGGQPMVDTEDKNMVSIAAKELEAGKLYALHGKLEVAIPLRPEVEAERLEAERIAREKREEALAEEESRTDIASLRATLEAEQAENELRQSETLREFSEQIMQFFGQDEVPESEDELQPTEEEEP